MQCPSCGFQNLPGLQQCARCASRLSLADVDVHPYRAGDRWARLRWLRLRWRYGIPLAERVSNVWTRLTRRDYWASVRTPDGIPAVQRLICIGASVIPGLGHLLAGRRRRGALLLGGYLLALVGSVLFMSSAWTLFTAVMLGIHTYAVADCVFYKAGYVTRRVSIATSLVIFLALAFGFYSGVTWLLGGVGRIEQLNVDTRSPLLDAGDVLLLTGRWNTPRYMPGDIVSYSIAGHGGPHHGGWYIQGGIMIDRIIAGPGDRVLCKDQHLTVNGEPLPAGRRPLVHTRWPDQLDLTVPQDSYFIYPTLVHVFVPRSTTEAAIRLDVSVVPAREIRGRVMAVVNPLSRVRVFRK